MTKAEAIEAGELAKAHGCAMRLLERANDKVREKPDELILLELGDDWNESGHNILVPAVFVRPWMAALVLNTLVGVIGQRLACLGVDASELEAEHG